MLIRKELSAFYPNIKPKLDFEKREEFLKLVRMLPNPGGINDVMFS